MIKAILARRGNKQRLSATAPVYLFQYITPAMIATVAAVSSIVVLNFDQLKINFITNVPLNGLIIGILCISIFGAIMNNLRLYHTAKFMQRINHMLDDTHTDDTITKEKILLLRRSLNTRAFTINTANMQKGIDNLERYQRLNLNDTDARLIKSKVGFRVRLSRGSVGFLAGILVMLGLLGTFWGLLKTIDSVGEAMGAMSNIGGGEGGEVDMSGFITSIAAPLQGMGLAFSSSLFGLSGSLLIGFFNFLCGSSQNIFIEKMSLWVDSHLATFSPKKQAEGVKQEATISKDEMRNMLAGVTYLNNQVNLKLSELLPTLQQAADAMVTTSENVNHLSDSQRKSASDIQSISQSCTQIASETSQMTASLKNDITPLSQQVIDQMTNHIGPALQENIALTKSDILPSLQKTSDILTEEIAPQAKDFHQNSLSLQKEQFNAWQSYVNMYQETHKARTDSWQNLEKQLAALQDMIKEHGNSHQSMQKTSTETLQSQTQEIIKLTQDGLKAANDQHRELIALNKNGVENQKHDKQQFTQLNNNLEQMVQQQHGLKTESEKLRHLLEKEPDHAYHTQMVKHIENIISEVSSKVINTNDKKRFTFWKK